MPTQRAAYATQESKIVTLQNAIHSLGYVGVDFLGSLQGDFIFDCLQMNGDPVWIVAKEKNTGGFSFELRAYLLVSSATILTKS